MRVLKDFFRKFSWYCSFNPFGRAWTRVILIFFFFHSNNSRTSLILYWRWNFFNWIRIINFSDETSCNFWAFLRSGSRVWFWYLEKIYREKVAFKLKLTLTLIKCLFLFRVARRSSGSSSVNSSRDKSETSSSLYWLGYK